MTFGRQLYAEPRGRSRLGLAAAVSPRQTSGLYHARRGAMSAAAGTPATLVTHHPVSAPAVPWPRGLQKMLRTAASAFCTGALEARAEKTAQAIGSRAARLLRAPAPRRNPQRSRETS